MNNKKETKTSEWRNRPSIKRRATALDLENTTKRMTPYMSSEQLDSVKFFFSENNVEISDGNGQYRYWINDRHIGSTYLLAKYFVPSLPATQTEFKTLKKGDFNKKRKNEDDGIQANEMPNQLDNPVDSISTSVPVSPEVQAYVQNMMATERERMEREKESMKKMYEKKIASLVKKMKNGEPVHPSKKKKVNHTTSSDPPNDFIQHQNIVADTNLSSNNIMDGSSDAVGSDRHLGLFDDYETPPTANPLTQAVMNSLSLEQVDESVFTLKHVEDMFEKQIYCFGKLTTMEQVCNFTAGNVFDTARHKGVIFASAHEQGFKSSLIAALMGVSSITRRPTLLIAGLAHDQTKEMTSKMEQILESFNIKSRFLSNAEGGWERFKNDQDAVDQFKQGKLLIVTPGYAMARATILDEIDATNAMVILDESDNILKKDPSMWTPGSKEDSFGKLISNPQDINSRVSSVVLISATHLADFHIWKHYTVPKLYISASMDLLRDRGYTTHADMQQFQDVDMKDINVSTKYGIETPAFKMLMHDFKTCPGRRKLMLVASSPFVNSDNKCTLFTQADAILDQDEEALIIIHFSGKCFFACKDKDKDGKKHFVEMISICHDYLKPSKKKEKRVKTIEKALLHLEKRYCGQETNPNRDAAGPSNRPVPLPIPARDRRFIVIGYNALARSTSPRTATIVPTHTFVAMGKGRNAADVRQTTMRPAGKTTEVRRANGHDKVKVVTPKEDWDMVCALYGFQELIADESMRNPNFDFEKYEEYSIAAEPVVKSTRSMAPPQIRMMPAWNYKATAVEEEEARARKEAERREMEERRRIFILENISSAEVETAEPTTPGDEDKNEKYVTGTINENAIKLLKALLVEGPVRVKGELSLFAKERGIDLQSGHRKIVFNLRRSGLITPADGEFVSLTPKGVDFIEGLSAFE